VNVVLGCTLILLGPATLPLFSQGAKPSTMKKPAAEKALPSLWTSLSSQKDFRVRIDKDRFYAEWIVPPEAAKKGAYIRTVCRRSGNKWIGTSRVFVLCPDPADAGAKKVVGCPLTVRFEVDSITADRISGSSETPRAGFDCQKCQVLQMGWGNFAWVPKTKSTQSAASGKK
jgi:hypothetical protein